MAISARKFRDELKKNGIFYTDEKLAKEMRALFPDDVDEVYDPTCGDGSLLKAFPETTVKYGQDILSEQVECARKENKNFHGVVGDTLKSPAFSGKKFKYIVANPPFSVRWTPDELADDVRFSCAPALPPQSKADYAFILHILSYLAEDGMAAVLNFPGILYRGQREGKIREWIVRNNWVERVVHIPGGHFEDTNIATALVVFRKNKTTTDVIFEDRENGLGRSVTLPEIEANNFSLSVSNYIQPPQAKKEENPAELQKNARKAFIEKLKRDLDFDFTVCQIENNYGNDFSFVEYLDEIEMVVKSYKDKISRKHDIFTEM